MSNRTKQDIEIISQALDELMICKSRAVMPIEAKAVWLKRLVDIETDTVLWAIERVICSSCWPEIYAIFEQCREYDVVHAEQIQRNNMQKFMKANEAYERQLISGDGYKHMTIEEARKMLMDRT